MKKIKKIEILVLVFVLGIYNTCFADVVYDFPSVSDFVPIVNKMTPLEYLLFGILVGIIIFCVIVIVEKIKENKEKKNK